MYNNMINSLIGKDNRNLIFYYGKDIRKNTFLERINSFSNYLAEKGIQKGDVIAVCLPNIPSAIFAVYAINKVGAIANLIHPLMPPLGLKKIIDNTNSKMLIYLDSFYLKGMDILADIPTILCNVSDNMGMPIKLFAKFKTRNAKKITLQSDNTISMKECLLSNYSYIPPNVLNEDIAVYLHSGGTTGSPKTIMLSNRSLNACAKNTGKVVEELRPNNDSMLMVLPLFHGFGLGVAMHTTLCKQGKVILLPRFNGKTVVKLIKKQPLTYIAGVPTMYQKIMETKGFKGKHLLKIKRAFCGGEKLPLAVKEKWDAIMQEVGSRCTILEGYGLTEMLTVTHLNPADNSKYPSVGLPLAGIKQKIIDSDGIELPNGEAGEICLSGGTIMSGYLNDQELTVQVKVKDKEGISWIKTGDCGYIDDEGYLYFKERIKRMLKVSGINVFPQEIENTVCEMKEIKQACALEIDYYSKVAVKLFIVLEDGIQFTDELKLKIDEYIAKRLMKYSRPRIIESRKEMPLTLVGKVNYIKLKEIEEARGALTYNK